MRVGVRVVEVCGFLVWFFFGWGCYYGVIFILGVFIGVCYVCFLFGFFCCWIGFSYMFCRCCRSVDYGGILRIFGIGLEEVNVLLNECN